jgi:CDP-4-dehydro-6-deoxyglucose reductase
MLAEDVGVWEDRMDHGATRRVFEISIRGADKTVRCSASERVAVAIENAFPYPQRLPIRVGCRRGGCGVCRVRVLSGDYSTCKMSRAHVSDTDETARYALACCLFAESDLAIEPAFLGPRRRRECSGN